MTDDCVPADRNKTKLTHDITRAAHQWLDNHGFKPVETEVWMPWDSASNKGWIADLAGVIAPTQTELINMKMIPRPPRYEYGKDSGKRNADYKVRREEWEALYRPLSRMMTCLVEVKASRSDFRKDRKWKMTPPTDLAYVAMPAGIAKKEEWPDAWGILELRGDVVAQIRTPTPRFALDSQHFDVVYQLALACDHRVRYAELRAQQKAQRVNDAERITIERLDRVISAVHDIAAGHLQWTDEPLASVEQAFRAHGIRNARECDLEKLGKLFKIAARTKEES